MKITAAQIRRLTPNAVGWIVDGIVSHQNALAQHGITTPLRLAHFMAQLAHESAHFRTTREYASGKAYEGRRDLGNTKPGDGQRFRGRGLIQITGRHNSATAGKALGRPYEDRPELMEHFPDALLVSLWYWKSRNINQHADRDDIVAVTRAINGGINGLADRRQYLAKAKAIWVEPQRKETPVMTSEYPTLRRGVTNDAVRTLQSRLVEHGVNVSVDGQFGPQTEAAVKDFQATAGLTADGIVGPQTWAALTQSTIVETPTSTEKSPNLGIIGSIVAFIIVVLALAAALLL